MSAISGGLRKLSIRRGGTSGSWIDVAHVVSDSKNSQTDFAETTTRNNKGFKSFVPVAIGGTIEVTGIIFDDEDIVGKIGWKELKEVQESFEKIEYRLQVLGDTDIEYGNMYIANIGDTADVEGLYEYSLSFQLTDKPEILGDDSAPTAPFLQPLLLDNVNANIRLLWDAATDDVAVVGYEVRKSESVLPDIIIDVGNVSGWIDLGAAQFVTYGYNVRAYDAVGNRGPWSNKRLGTLIPTGGIEEPILNYILQENDEYILTEGNSILELEG